jgi:polyisoprenoid-binding protein YceI
MITRIVSVTRLRARAGARGLRPNLRGQLPNSRNYLRDAARLGRGVFAVALAASFALPALIADAAATAIATNEIVQLDPARTVIDITLLGNLHDTDGRFKLKSGTIRVDPQTGNATGAIVIDAASEDSHEDLRDAIIKNGILEVARYPEIIFTPDRVQGTRDPQGNFYGEIVGAMWLHGSVHPMTVQIHGHLIGDQITASCEFLVPYLEWGVESPNVLSSRQIVNSTKGVNTTMFSLFAYLLPALRRIPPNLFGVSDLVQVKVETNGSVGWALHPLPEKLTVIAPAR